ncbi:MAG: DUF4105 domain-containing protein [Deltaproteobacteria bacterium]|nr:DUF4105 domain-containing protein [Deltaproteobacteria bacterium]
MHGIWAWSLWTVLAGAGLEGRAESSNDERGRAPTLDVQLLTMEPGDELFTRGGHVALLVSRSYESGAPTTTVYNYGDADWDNPALVWDFVRGRLVFFLSSSGTLDETITTYGVRQARDVYRQPLVLTPAQAAAIVKRLEREVVRGQGDYVFHQTRALCSTRVRDLIDEVLGGAVRAQLSERPDPRTVRDYQQWTFAGFTLASLGGDLLMGRMHDAPLEQFSAAYVPYRLREYLQQVQVPDPWAPGRTVPLAGKPVPLALREQPLPERGANLSAPIFGGGLALLLVGLGGLAAIGRRARPWWASAGLALWAASSGAVGLALLVVLCLSRVREFWLNELLLSFWATDLLLFAPAIAWTRGRTAAWRWLDAYVSLRLATGAVVLVGRLSGVLYQRPVWWWAAGLVGVTVSFIVVRRMRPRAAALGSQI